MWNTHQIFFSEFTSLFLHILGCTGPDRNPTTTSSATARPCSEISQCRPPLTSTMSQTARRRRTAVMKMTTTTSRSVLNLTATSPVTTEHPPSLQMWLYAEEKFINLTSTLDNATSRSIRELLPSIIQRMDMVCLSCEHLKHNQNDFTDCFMQETLMQRMYFLLGTVKINSHIGNCCF